MNDKQIICTCNGTTVAEIEKAVKEGAGTFEEIQEKLHVGKQCVKCRDLIRLLIESFMEE